MENKGRRTAFLGVVAALVLLIVGISVYASVTGPKNVQDSGIAPVVNRNTPEGKIIVKDPYEGEITIPKYNIPVNNYIQELFGENDKGILTYNEIANTGVTVSENNQEIDWAKVKESGVSFAMIRVGYRKYSSNEITQDKQFEANIAGALAVGLDVGVYFYSTAISVTEAEQEAAFVLDKIKAYQVTYPVSYNWEFVQNAQEGETVRNKDATGSEITEYTEAFCKKIEKASYTAAFYAGKNMAYEKFNLEKLKDYDIWYSEYRKVPAFYYDFNMWQYTNQGKVSGIETPVKMNMVFKTYR